MVHQEGKLEKREEKNNIRQKLLMSKNIYIYNIIIIILLL